MEMEEEEEEEESGRSRSSVQCIDQSKEALQFTNPQNKEKHFQ